MSWFMMGASVAPEAEKVYRVLYGLTEPLLAPMRRVIPTVRIGMGYLDLSPLILLMLLRVLQQVVLGYL